MSDERWFSSCTAPTPLMSSLMDYGSVRNDPLQALLASTHVQSRSPWQHLDDASSPSWQHSLYHHPTMDNITSGKGFHPWKWYTEPPIEGCVAALNKSVGDHSPPNSLVRQPVNGIDQCPQQAQQQLQQQSQQLQQQSWPSGLNAGQKHRLAPYGDYDNTGCYHQQPTCLAYGTAGTNGDLMSSLPTTYPFIDRKQQPTLDGSSDNDGGGCKSPTSSAAMAAAARMQAVARYFNDRWYSAAGYGSTHPTFDAGNSFSLSGGVGQNIEETSGLYASRTGMCPSSSSLSSLHQSNGHPPSVGSSLIPSPGGALPSGWMWNTGSGGCGVNTSYLLNSCSQLSDHDHNKSLLTATAVGVLSDYREQIKNDFRFPSIPCSGSATNMTSAQYVESRDQKERAGVDRKKLSPESKKRRCAESGDGRYPQPSSRPMTSTTTSQHVSRVTASGVTSSMSSGTRSTASACECPNCREADLVGGAAGEQLRRLGQHSCHVPGCGKVYSKTSHLKAHLHWHNAGSSVINTGTGGYTVKELQTGSGNKNLEDQRFDGQRPQTTSGEDRKPPSDRLLGSKRNRKKQQLRAGAKSGNCEPSSVASSNLHGSSYRNNNVTRSTADGPTGSCKTQRQTVAVESSGRYDLANGDNYATVDNEPSPPPRHLLTIGSSSETSTIFCDISDNGKKCHNELRDDSAMRSNDHPTVLVVNG